MSNLEFEQEHGLVALAVRELADAVGEIRRALDLMPEWEGKGLGFCRSLADAVDRGTRGLTAQQRTDLVLQRREESKQRDGRPKYGDAVGEAERTTERLLGMRKTLTEEGARGVIREPEDHKQRSF